MTKDDTAAASFGGSATARSMELLWGTKPPPGRGRKPGMTVYVIAAAVELADAERMDGVSTRRVADRLGVGTMSLQDLMLDTVMGGAPPVHEGGGWRAGLERFARASLDGYRRYPWLLRASPTRGAMGPNQAAAVDSVLRALDETGLPGGERTAVVGLVAGYARGVARQLVEATCAEQRTGVSDEQFCTGFAPLLDAHLDPFDFGLRRVLDGVETLVDAHRAGS
ncbi:MAG TPA: TetR/AcrR family transcriptional regulator C-terminal domain-containing protein [Actinophytocola sp.]|jgi:hypothetical protein|nr:TetR/AcrR family transcriptional regulator C-terminal domain-containing protein [Actinophytocola sp.]